MGPWSLLYDNIGPVITSLWQYGAYDPFSLYDNMDHATDLQMILSLLGNWPLETNFTDKCSPRSKNVLDQPKDTQNQFINVQKVCKLLQKPYSQPYLGTYLQNPTAGRFLRLPLILFGMSSLWLDGGWNDL